MFIAISFITMLIIVFTVSAYLTIRKIKNINTLYASINMGDQLIREVKQNYRYTSPWNTPKECKATVTNKGDKWIQLK